MVMQIKGKFIKNAALDSSKILLSAGQALRILAQDGTEKRLIELSSEGKVLVNGSEVALKSDIVNTSAAIESSLAAEVAAREAADMVLDGKITTEKNRAEAAEAGLASDIAAETSARQSAISGVQADLATEQAARIAGDAATLASAQSYADQKVADLVNSAPAVLDTLKELADAIGGDENFATTIANQIGAVSASVTAEETRAMGAEAGLASDIAAETAARQTAISGEASARAAAVATLEASIASEASARTAAVSAEQARAESAEAGLAADIASAEAAASAAVSAEEARAMAAESALDARLDVVEGSGAGSIAKALQDAKDYADAGKAAEQSRAQTAEAGLATDIAAVASDLADETSARQNAISTVEAAVTAEETRAMNAESALDARLDVLEGNGAGSVAKAESDAKAYADQKVADLVNSAPAVLDTLKELADALGQDPNFATTVAGQIGAVAADLATETSRAQSAEANLSSDISAEASARAAAVSAEQARAEAAESALSGRVSTLEAKAFYKEKFVLTQEDIDNGFVEFARAAMSNSVVAFADRLAIHQGSDQDFTMSVVAGKSRMTFVNNLIDPSPEKLSAGDVINVTYMA